MGATSRTAPVSGTLGWLIQNGGVLNINAAGYQMVEGRNFPPGDAKVTTQQVVGM